MSDPRDPNLESPRPRDGNPADGPRGVRVTDEDIAEHGFDDPELRPLPTDKLHYHVPHSDPHPELHEHSDVPIRPLAIALGGIALTCVLTFFLLYFVFWNFKRGQEAQERPRTAIPAAKPIVPGPRLQGVPGFSDNHPTQDMDQVRARYKAKLDGYGGNGDAPTARIPIGRAIDLALERKIFPVGETGAQGGNDSNASNPQRREGPAVAPGGIQGGRQ